MRAPPVGMVAHVMRGLVGTSVCVLVASWVCTVNRTWTSVKATHVKTMAHVSMNQGPTHVHVNQVMKVSLHRSFPKQGRIHDFGKGGGDVRVTAKYYKTWRFYGHTGDVFSLFMKFGGPPKGGGGGPDPQDPPPPWIRPCKRLPHFYTRKRQNVVS